MNASYITLTVMIESRSKNLYQSNNHHLQQFQFTIIIYSFANHCLILLYSLNSCLKFQKSKVLICTILRDMRRNSPRNARTKEKFAQRKREIHTGILIFYTGPLEPA